MAIILDCPSDPVAGPVKTASDGALGFTIKSALRNAHQDAHDEADDEIIDEIMSNYRCRGDGCRIVPGPHTPLGHRQLGSPRRAWWTLWIMWWAEYEATATRYVQCLRIPREEEDE